MLNAQLPTSNSHNRSRSLLGSWRLRFGMGIGRWSYFRVGALSIRAGRGAAATPLFSVSQNEPRPSGVS